MPHIHTAPGQHDQTITGLIIRLDGPEPRVFMHMHRKLGKLLPVGGHVELLETPWQAMAHELAEESGYRLPEVAVLQPVERMTQLTGIKTHPYPVVVNTHTNSPDHFHSDLTYAFVAMGDPAQAIAEGESTDVRWLTQAEMNALGTDIIFENTQEMYNFVLDIFLQSWERVSATNYVL